MTVLEKMEVTAQLWEFGIGIQAENLRRRYPDATDDELEQRLIDWIGGRPPDGHIAGLTERMKTASGGSTIP